jgi:hypothetical protein
VTERCSESSYDGRMRWKCTRPVKADGLCAQHLAGAKRRKANDEKRQAEWQAEDQRRDALEAKIARLKQLGVAAYMDSRDMRVTGKVIVDPDVLLALLERERVSR